MKILLIIMGSMAAVISFASADWLAVASET